MIIAVPDSDRRVLQTAKESSQKAEAISDPPGQKVNAPFQPRPTSLSRGEQQVGEKDAHEKPSDLSFKKELSPSIKPGHAVQSRLASLPEVDTAGNLTRGEKKVSTPKFQQINFYSISNESQFNINPLSNVSNLSFHRPETVGNESKAFGSRLEA